MEVHFEITTPIPINGAALSFQVYDSMSQSVLHLLTLDTELPMCREPGVFYLICKIPKLRIYIGCYSIKVHLAEYVGGKKFQTIDNICPFEVVVYGQYRDYYWYPGNAKYIEECYWQIKPKLGLLKK
jgi:lipopolysaccharide transport system ATP-binding protein